MSTATTAAIDGGYVAVRIATWQSEATRPPSGPMTMHVMNDMTEIDDIHHDTINRTVVVCKGINRRSLGPTAVGVARLLGKRRSPVWECAPTLASRPQRAYLLSLLPDASVSTRAAPTQTRVACQALNPQYSSNMLQAAQRARSGGAPDLHIIAPTKFEVNQTELPPCLDLSFMSSADGESRFGAQRAMHRKWFMDV